MSGTRSRGPWRLHGGNCGAMLGILGADGPVAMLGVADRLKAGDIATLVMADEFAQACALFTAAAHDARSALNDAGLPCPSSIALAAEKARNALAAGHALEEQLAAGRKRT